MCQSYIIIPLKKSNPIFLTPAVSFMIEIFIQIISQLYLTRFNLPDLFLLLVPSILFQNTMAAFGYFCTKNIWDKWQSLVPKSEKSGKIKFKKRHMYQYLVPLFFQICYSNTFWVKFPINSHCEKVFGLDEVRA